MSPDSFDQLSQNQGIAMLISMHVRNELKDFHVKHLQDNIMPELNSTIRYASYDFFDNAMKSDKTLGWLAMMVPDY